MNPLVWLRARLRGERRERPTTTPEQRDPALALVAQQQGRLRDELTRLQALRVEADLRRLRREHRP